MPETKYKWDSPLAWLKDAMHSWTRERLYDEVTNLTKLLGPGSIEDTFGASMQASGYYDPVSGDCPISKLHEGDVVEFAGNTYHVRQITFYDIHIVEVTDKHFKKCCTIALPRPGDPHPEKTVNLKRRCPGTRP